MAEKLYAVSSSLPAGAQHRAQDFLSMSSSPGPIAAPDFAVDDRRADGLLCEIVGGLDPGMLQEGEKLIPMPRKMLGEALVGLVRSRPAEDAIQPALQSSDCHRQASRGNLPIVPEVS